MFTVQSEGDILNVFLDNRRVIVHTPDEPFVWVGKGKWNTAQHRVTNSLQSHSPLIHASYDAGRQVIRFFGGEFSLSFRLSEAEGNLLLSPQRSTTGLSRMRLQFPAKPNSAVFGGGAQYRDFNLRGKRIPLWVRETRVMERIRPNTAMKLIGEKAFPSSFPIPMFMTSEHFWYYFDCSAPVVFDFTHSRTHHIEFYDLPSSITIGYSDSQLGALKKYTQVAGRQPVLPTWIVEGACLEVRGGSEEILKTLQFIVEHKAAVSSLWIKDWTGAYKFGGEDRPFYDWHLNHELYPKLDEIIPELLSHGIRTMAYINPHLSIEGTLFAEASMRNFLVKKPQGGNYIRDMGGSMAGLIDLTNPTACSWFKEIIKQSILAAGFCGYMADRGDYLPADAVLYSGESPINLHNKWPVLWAALNREAVREAGRTADTVFYVRSGWGGSGSQTLLSSTGDHIIGWGHDTGLPSALTASLSFACSGIGMSFTDCGGNVNFLPLNSKELVMRWIDYAAFTPVFKLSLFNLRILRADKTIAAHFARMSRVHAALSPYIRQLMRDNTNDGAPLMRTMFMQYPSNAATSDIKNQYMLGSELLVAPVLLRHQKNIKVTLPEGQWTNIWNGKDFAAGTHTVQSGIGKPPVFYKTDGKYAELFAGLAK